MPHTLKIFNTLTRKKDFFTPLRTEEVGFYTCGPTVYNFAHIGNLRTYIFEDALKRVLLWAGYHVTHVMNTTDVDDKTIRASRETGMSLKKFTRHYEKVFLGDLKTLNIIRPTVLARATEHIPEMIALVQTLLKKKVAYIKDGSVYFDISKFKRYGKLARLDTMGLRAGARIDADEYQKDAVQDFVLWKGRKPHEPYWNAPFGEGRPGWHVECSAMSMKYLGSAFDVHAAGVDLIFPHHENEIAQSEAATGKKFVRYWVHGEHLLVDGKKMSKSLHNIFTLRDIKKKFSPLAFRYLVLTSHYRSKLNFTWESLAAAAHSLNRMYDFIRELKKERKRIVANRNLLLASSVDRFHAAILDDLDTPVAIAVFWGLTGDYRKKPQQYNPKELLRILYGFDHVLGLGLKNIKSGKIPETVLSLVQKREQLRKEKRWKEADAVRNEIKKLGYTIRDKIESADVLKEK